MRWSSEQNDKQMHWGTRSLWHYHSFKQCELIPLRTTDENDCIIIVDTFISFLFKENFCLSIQISLRSFHHQNGCQQRSQTTWSLRHHELKWMEKCWKFTYKIKLFPEFVLGSHVDYCWGKKWSAWSNNSCNKNSYDLRTHNTKNSIIKFPW